MKNYPVRHSIVISLILILTFISSNLHPVAAQTLDTETPAPTNTETITPTVTETATETSTPTATTTTDPSVTATASIIPPSATQSLVTLYPNVYDDNYPYIRYTGWKTHTVTGLYFNSEHYSAQAGNTVEFTFHGTSFSIRYRLFPTFGNLGVRVDGEDLSPIVMTNDYETRDMVYTSPNYSDGEHTVTLTHLTGLYIAFDAIDIFGIPTETPQPSETSYPSSTSTATNTYIPSRTNTSSSTPTVTLTPMPVGPGLYDDNDYHFGYNGWQYHAVSGLIMDSEHYSSTSGSTANLVFDGVSAAVHYRKFNTFGTVQFYIDGVFQAAINQNNPSEVLNQTWTSAIFPAGKHTLSIVHLSGSYVVFDAVTVSGPGTPTYTLTASNTSTATRTKTLTKTASNTASITITPSASKTPTASRTLTPSRTPTPTQTPATIPSIKIDDTDYRIVYTGWLQRGVTGLYNNTEHYSSMAGDTVYLVFRGTGITIFYRGFSTFGTVGVAIDGVSVGEINENNNIEIRNQSWTSGAIPLGVHTLTLTHLTKQYAVLDAILIDGPATNTPTATITNTSTSTKTVTNTKLPSNTPTASRTFTPSKTPTKTSTATSTKTPSLVGLGTIDDNDSRFQYSGWVYHKLTGSFSGTEHYSTGVGGKAMIRFMGEGLSVRYRTASNFGTMQVSIDGVLYTINQNSTTPQNNLIWTSPALSPGVHVLELTHTSGLYVTLDAIIVSGTPTSTPTKTSTKTATASRTPTITLTPSLTSTPSITPTMTTTPLPAIAGTYDDNDYRFLYNGWLYHPLTGLFNNTEHYSQQVGNTATIIMNGSGFTVKYRKYKSFGKLEVRVDGVLVTTISQYSASELRNQSWVSPNLTAGVHTITLTHATGTTVAMDALVIR